MTDDTKPARHWHTQNGTTCKNCVYVLSRHKNQIHCPQPAEPDAMEPKLVALTDEQVEAIIESWWRDDLKMKYAQLCRLVERAHGIKSEVK